MKHKITQVEEVHNEEELQKVKNTKEMHKTILKIVASMVVGTAGFALYEMGAAQADFEWVPMALGVGLQFICYGMITPRLLQRLRELRNKKPEEQQNELEEKHDDISGGLSK